MSPMLSPEVVQQLKEQADRVRQRLDRTGSQDLAKFADLSGKRAIVLPGKSVIIRLLPRWDIAKRFMVQDGKMVINPSYPQQNVSKIYMGALEHWFDNPVSGKPNRLWCRTMIKERCPLCEASTALIAGASAEDKALGKDIRQKEVYLFNIILRAAMYNDKGVPDIRILLAPPTIWVAIIDTMTGGPEAEESFAKGEIFDPKEGYDLLITRPVAGGGDRYKVGCANNPSLMFPAADLPKWSNPPWTTLLHDLEEEVGPNNIRSYDEMYRTFYNSDPDPGTADHGSPAASAGVDISHAAGFGLPAGAVEETPDPMMAGFGGTGHDTGHLGIGLPGADPPKEAGRARTRTGR